MGLARQGTTSLRQRFTSDIPIAYNSTTMCTYILDDYNNVGSEVPSKALPTADTKLTSIIAITAHHKRTLSHEQKAIRG